MFHESDGSGSVPSVPKCEECRPRHSCIIVLCKHLQTFLSRILISDYVPGICRTRLNTCNQVYRVVHLFGWTFDPGSKMVLTVFQTISKTCPKTQKITRTRKVKQGLIYILMVSVEWKCRPSHIWFSHFCPLSCPCNSERGGQSCQRHHETRGESLQEIGHLRYLLLTWW